MYLRFGCRTYGGNKGLDGNLPWICRLHNLNLCQEKGRYRPVIGKLTLAADIGKLLHTFTIPQNSVTPATPNNVIFLAIAIKLHAH